MSLAANIAANHPKQGLCQVERLRQYGVSKAHIDAVIEIDTESDAIRPAFAC